jgi:hypothetical protein
MASLLMMKLTVSPATEQLGFKKKCSSKTVKPVWSRKTKTMIRRCLAGPFGNRPNKHFVSKEVLISKNY